MYLATQEITDQERAKLQKIFMFMDKNADGKLERDELIKGYRALYPSMADVEVQVDKIMNSVDIDKSGYIEYSEFVIALMNKKKLVSEENLRKAFNLFDKDGSGTITTNEVKNVLGVGKNVSEEIWSQLLKEVDENSDGKISFEEFTAMMNKFGKK